MNYLWHYPQYFNSNSLLALALSALFCVCALFTFRKNELAFKIVLFLIGISVAYFACSLDIFLHRWDEQYHALVAKNMMSDLFNPVLYKNSLLATNTEHWSSSHIWLHKQPLFLWQMSLSMKIFGLNEIALRLPNIIAHGFLVVFVYDMGKELLSDFVGLLSAITFCYLRFPLSYSAGMEATDHNDYMFLFYVTASFWALFKYNNSKKIQYLVLVGVFVGSAVLVKWLAGFLVIGVWISYCLLYERKIIMKPLMAFLIAVVIALPWQIYCYIKYKTIFLSEMSFNSRHISESLEGHVGDWYYHLNGIKELYANNDLIFLIIGVAVALFILNKKVIPFHKFSILLSIALVYVFFSFVKTKMPAFCIIVIPLVILIIISSLVEVMNKIKQTRFRRLIYLLLVPQLIIFFFSPSYFIKRHTLNYRPNEHTMSKYIYERAFIQELGKQMSGKKLVFINANGLAVKLMFYLDCDATDKVLDKETISNLKLENYQLVAFKRGLPEYIISDKTIIKI